MTCPKTGSQCGSVMHQALSSRGFFSQGPRLPAVAREELAVQHSEEGFPPKADRWLLLRTLIEQRLASPEPESLKRERRERWSERETGLGIESGGSCWHSKNQPGLLTAAQPRRGRRPEGAETLPRSERGLHAALCMPALRESLVEGSDLKTGTGN